MTRKTLYLLIIILMISSLIPQIPAVEDSVLTTAPKKTIYPYQNGEHLSFDWIFEVRDWTMSYFDKEKVHTLKFEKELREGSYEVDIDIDYDQTEHKATFFQKRKGKKNKNAVINIPENVMDPLSALFYVRTLDLKIGDEILIPATDNKKVYDIKVIVHKMETVEVPAGKFRCFVVEPIMADGGVFKKDGKVQVWLTADKKKMPVMMRTKVYIGSITAELNKYTLR
jgi:hypothetical protein